MSNYRKANYRTKDGQRLTAQQYKNRRKFEIILHLSLLVACIVAVICLAVTLIHKSIHNANTQEVVETATDTATAELTLAATKIQDYMNRYRNVEEIMVGFTMAYKYSSKKEDEIETMYHSTVKGFRNSSENITNLYCYINDKFIDGSGWVPDEDFNPKERQWYIKALESQGRSVYVLPYKVHSSG